MKICLGVAASIMALIFSCASFAQNQPQPATLRSILLHELVTTHNQADWFVPINTAVEGLTPEQANWQPAGGGHSAGELTYHLLFWNRLNLERLQGKSPGKFSGNNDETFTKFDDKQWTDTVKQLDQVMTDLESWSNPPMIKNWHQSRPRFRISALTTLTMSDRLFTCASCKARGIRKKV